MEKAQATRDVRVPNGQEPLERKPLDRKTGHDGSKKQRLVQRGFVQPVAFLVEKPNKSSGKCIAGAGGIKDLFQRVSGRTENIFLREQ